MLVDNFGGTRILTLRNPRIIGWHWHLKTRRGHQQEIQGMNRIMKAVTNIYKTIGRSIIDYTAISWALISKACKIHICPQPLSLAMYFILTALEPMHNNFSITSAPDVIKDLIIDTSSRFKIPQSRGTSMLLSHTYRT